MTLDAKGPALRGEMTPDDATAMRIATTTTRDRGRDRGERGMGQFAERDERVRGEREHRERGPREHAERGRRGDDADRDVRHEETGRRHRGESYRGEGYRRRW